MSRSQTIYKLLVVGLLLIGNMLFWRGQAFAQSASDLEITAIPTDAQCLADGKVTINVKKKAGSPYTIESKVYDLRDESNNSLAGAGGQYVTNNVIGGLGSGKYKAYAKVRFVGGIEVSLGPVPVSVKSDYKIPTVAIKLERKTLKSWKREGAGPRVPTGVVSILVTGGNRPPYKVRLIEKPVEYTDIEEHDLELGKRLFLYELPEGTYKFQVSDACGGGQAVQTIKMETVNSDVPQGGVLAGQNKLVLPFSDDAFSSEETRHNCRWFLYKYTQRGIADYVGKDQELYPYLSPRKALNSKGEDITKEQARDTIAKYYNYGFSYGEATPPAQYYAAGQVPFGPATSGTAADKETMGEVYGRILNGKTWSEAGYSNDAGIPINPEVFPALFLQVKGSDEHMNKGYRGRRNKTKVVEFANHWKQLVDPCKTDYTVTIIPTESWTELFCYPIRVGLYEENNSTPVASTTEEVLDGKSTKTTNFGKVELKAGRDYWIKATDGSGAKVEYKIRLEDKFEYKTTYTPANAKTNPESFDICARKRAGSVSLSRRLPIGTPFYNHTVTLLQAPDGYVPAEDGLELNQPFTLPDKKTVEEALKGSGIRIVSDFFAFGKKSEYFMKDRMIFAPDGEYTYRIQHCDKDYEVKVTVDDGKTPKWTVEEKNFKPRLTNGTCGRIRIYPFAKENGTNFFFKSDFWERETNGKKKNYVDGPVAKPRELMIQIANYPSGVSDADLTHNMKPEHTWYWNSYRSLWFGAYDNPEELFFELPKTNGILTLRVAPFSHHNEYDYVFRDLTCMPTFDINLSNVPLSYDRASYVGYTCQDALSGQLFIVPTNNVGGVKIELFKDGKTIPFDTKTLQKDEVKNGASFTLTGTPGDEIPGKIRARLTDLECGNFNDETLFIYNLYSPEMIRTPNQQRKFCEGETIEISIMPLGESVTYEWTLPNGETRMGRTIKITNATFQYSGQYKVKISNVLCSGLPNAIERFFDISVAPRELWWRKDAMDADWHNLKNWAKKNGTPIDAVPAPCTTVHIPASVDKAFPDLAGNVTKRDVYGIPECDTIYFHYGSQLGTPQQLTYTGAYVDYNFGLMTSTGSIEVFKELGHQEADSKLLKRDHWYMIAAPLKDMLSGDYGVAGYPKTYQRYLKVSTATPLTEASFTKPFNTQVELLSKHNNAMALKVAGYRAGIKGYDDHKNLNKLRGIIRIPFFLNTYVREAYPHHKYDEGATTSTFWYYNENTLKLTNKTSTYKRNEKDAFRFVFENSGLGKIGNVTINGANMEGYSLLPEPPVAGNDWIMLGNPFMTPMDFDKFLAVNSAKIEPYYYLFTENGWKVYTKETAPVSNLRKEIAPLQSIVIRRKAAGELLFPTSGEKSVLLPAWREGLERYEVQAGKTQSPISELPLTASVRNSEGINSQAFLGWSSSVSAPVFVNNEYSASPAIFFVDPDDGQYNAIAYPKRPHGSIDLGVVSSISSPLTLSFEHIDHSVYEELVLVDKYENIEQDLLLNPYYDFVHKPDNAPATRFSLRVKRFGVTNVDPTQDQLSGSSDLKIYDIDGRLRVEGRNALHRVVLYDMQGRRFVDKVVEGNATCSVELDTDATHGVILVETFLKNGMRVIRKYDLR